MIFSFGYRSHFQTVALAFGVSATLFLGQLYGQTKPTDKPDKTKAEQPLELPEFVITGVESLDVPGGAKQSPKPASKLTQQDIRRFNPLDKQSFSLLPMQSIGRMLLPQQEKDGFVRGEFGMFITPSLEAGYRAVLGNFDLNANAAFTLSNGHRRNADFTDAALNLASTYLAPEKFFFFGGSRTDTRLSVHNRSYKFFGADSATFPETAPERSLLRLEADVQTVGSFENWQYDMGASLESALLSGSHANTALKGHISAQTTLGALHLGGKTDVALVQSSKGALGEQYRFAPCLLVGYRADGFALSAELGAHIVNDGFDGSGTTVRPAAMLQARLAASDVVTLELSGMTGVRPRYLIDALRINPYVPIALASALPQYYFERVLYDVTASARVQPTRNIAFTLGGSASRTDAAMLFQPTAVNGEISPLFASTSIIGTFAEAYLQFTENDILTTRINARFGMRFSPTGTVEQGVPYLIPIEGRVVYRRAWLPQLETQVEAVYVGNRTVLASPDLPAYWDVRLNAEYRITQSISVYARGTNLLNQQITLWQRYQERGIFIALGFVITF